MRPTLTILDVADAYVLLSPFAARYAVGIRIPYNKRQPRNGRLGNNIINAETAGEKRSRWLLLKMFLTWLGE